MNDTIDAMRSFALVLVACAAAACADDPTLHVAVTHPQGLAIATTVITDYESPSLTCEDVEFSRLSPAQLAAVAVASETIDASGHATGALTGISRADPKVIVAQGFDASGQLLAAGCAEQGVVSGSVTLAIATAPAATVSLGVDGTDPGAVLVSATDPLGAPIDARAVSWTVYGPAGSTANGSAQAVSDGVWQASAPSCTAGGTLQLHPVQPAVIGGFEVQVRVAWQTALPPPYTGLVNPGTSLTPLAPPTGARHYCAARISGSERDLVCLEGSGANVFAREYHVAVDATGRATASAVPGPRAVPYGAALVSVPDAANAGDLDVLAITQAGVIVPVFSTVAVSNSDPVCASEPCATPVDDALYLPACGMFPARLVMHVSGLAAAALGQQLQGMAASGGARMTFPLVLGAGEDTAQLDRAGCVTDLRSSLRQVLALDQGTMIAGTFVPTTTRLSYDCSASSCTETPLIAGAGVGFTGGSEPRVIIASVDATGVVLVQSVFAGMVGQRQLVERARYPALSLPDQIVAGQYDTDSTTDMVWSVPGKRALTTTLEVGYARIAGDQPLEAISSPEPFSVDDLESIDLTGDGHDDLIVTGAAGGVHGLLVVPADAPVAPAAATPDPPCAP